MIARWADEDSVYVGKGDTWTDVPTPNFETCSGPGKCIEHTCDITRATFGANHHAPTQLAKSNHFKGRWFRNKPKLVGTELQIACGRLGEALKTAETAENQMLMQLCHEKLDKLLQAVANPGGLADAQSQMCDLESMVIGLCEDPSALQATDKLREHCTVVKQLLELQSNALQLKIVGTLQTEAFKGKQFEKEAVDGVSVGADVDDMAMAEVAARRIQAVYRGRAGRIRADQRSSDSRTNQVVTLVFL